MRIQQTPLTEYSSGRKRPQITKYGCRDWDEDRVLRDAVLYRLLLLGEIASALPDALRDRYPDVPWRQIRAFRDLAVHKYFSVDWAVVWQISLAEVPVLEEQAMGIMRAEFPELAKTYEPETIVESGPGDTTGPGQEQTA
ncbi:MAG TPA: HepT-like ribonuclease domain-containing protein [Streptosporangiaceae bacterium]|nr:HepT-like ribonuclease domain-containing protein [Streptosporangiaceae bacterium]